MKSQSAMEYLITYSWAVLFIAIALATVYALGVFGSGSFVPTATAGSCQVQRPNGPGTTSLISLQGICNNDQPQYVTSFTSGGTANVANGISTIDTAWNGGNWTVVAWVLVNNMPSSGTQQFVAEETTGCNSGLWIYTKGTSGTQFQTNAWYGANSLGPCYGTTLGSFTLTSDTIVPFGTWAMATAEVHIGGSSTGNWISVCTDTVCNNQSWTASVPPSNYKQYYGTGSQLLWQFGSGTCCGSPNMNLYMADVQLYDGALSQSDVKELYYKGIGGSPVTLQGLVGWWPLNGDSVDYSGEGNNATYSPGTYVSDWQGGYVYP